jgi:putative transposase
MNADMRPPGNANLPTGRGNKSGTSAVTGGGWRRANREIGGPGDPGGPWHSRGYLPHFDGRELIQHVTFHLADSLPREVLERVEEEIRILPADKQEIERRKRVEDWIDAGHGSCVLRQPAVAALVQGAFLHFDGSRYRLLAWVVMPNHVHVLFQSLGDRTVAQIVASWKKFTARGICDFRRAGNGNANLPIGSSSHATRESGVPEIGRNPTPVWHREYWDRFICNDCHFQQAVEYIRQNPVKAGLVERPEDWQWSSASIA